MTTAIYFALIALVILIVALIWPTMVNRLGKRRLNKCLQSIRAAACPRCKHVLGTSATNKVKQKMIKSRRRRFRILRGRDNPSRLITVVCPHCSVKLEFRLDGSLFRCDYVAVA